MESQFSTNNICGGAPGQGSHEKTDVQRKLTSPGVRSVEFLNDVCGSDAGEEIQQRIRGISETKGIL